MKALVKSHALRALDKRQWKCLKKWIQKCQAQQAAAPDLDHRKWNLCITCKWNVKRTQNERKLQKFKKKVGEITWEVHPRVFADLFQRKEKQMPSLENVEGFEKS